MPREPNTLLADVMRRAAISNSNLAAHVRRVAEEHGADLKCTRVDVRRWLDGVIPRPATAGFIAAALGRKGSFRVSLSDIGMARLASTASPEDPPGYPADGPAAGQQLLDLTRRDLAGETGGSQAGIVADAWVQPALAWLLARPEPVPVRDGARISVGESDVAAMKTTVGLFMRMDFEFGGGYARASLAQYYAHDVHPLLEGKFSDKVGRELFSAAAQVAQLLGWTAYDDGRHGLAQRYLLQGLRLAQAADDRMMGSRLLSNMSHQATWRGAGTRRRCRSRTGYGLAPGVPRHLPGGRRGWGRGRPGLVGRLLVPTRQPAVGQGRLRGQEVPGLPGSPLWSPRRTPGAVLQS